MRCLNGEAACSPNCPYGLPELPERLLANSVLIERRIMLREEITRGHRWQTLEELLDLIFTWLQQRARFMVEDAVYALSLAA